MYCPDCGNKIQENANFCFQCGFSLKGLNVIKDVNNSKRDDIEDKIAESEVHTDGTDFSSLKSEYEDIIIEKFIEAYFTDTDMDVEELYSDSDLYELSKEDVDKIIATEQSKIDKIDVYISKVYNKKFAFSDEDLDSFSNYIELLGYDDEYLTAFIEKYRKDNNLEEVEKFTTKALENYARKGELSFNLDTTLDESTKLKAIETTTNLINKMERKIGQIYSSMKPDEIIWSDKENNEWNKYGEQFGLRERGLNLILGGYKVKNGIFDQEDSYFQKIISNNISKYAPHKTRQWCNIRIDFGSEYFLDNKLNNQYEEQKSKITNGFKNIKGKEHEKINAIIRYIENTEQDLVLYYTKLMDVFMIDTKDSIAKVYRIGDHYSDIIDMSLGCIEGLREIADSNREYRNTRKEGRSRVIGIGSGVGGFMKASLTAGIMNAASGLAHSVANGVGNVHDEFKIKEAISSLLKTLEKIPTDYIAVLDEEHKLIINKIRKKFPQYFRVVDYKRVEELHNRLQSNMHDKESIVSLLKEDPKDTLSYMCAFTLCTSEKMRNEIASIANLFEVDLDSVINKEIKKFIDDSSSFSYKKIITFYTYNSESLTTIKENYCNRIKSSRLNEIKSFVKEINSDNAQYNSNLETFVTEINNAIYEKLIDIIKEPDYSEQMEDVLVEIKEYFIVSIPCDKYYSQVEEIYLNSIIRTNDIASVNVMITVVEKAKKIDKALGVSTGIQLVKQVAENKIIEVLNSKKTDHIKALYEYLHYASQNISEDFAMYLSEVDVKLAKLDKENRTFMGVEYGTLEEAEAEKNKYYNGVKYETEEEANNKKKEDTEKNKIATQEMNYIENLLNKNLPMHLEYEEMLKAKFVTEKAHEKIEETRKEFVWHYWSIRKSYEEINVMKVKKNLFLVLSVMSTLIGLPALLTAGWIIKFVIGFIVLCLWEKHADYKEEIEILNKYKKEIKEIEAMYNIINGNLALKPERIQQFTP